jgi:hypothetical protein
MRRFGLLCVPFLLALPACTRTSLDARSPEASTSHSGGYSSSGGSTGSGTGGIIGEGGTMATGGRMGSGGVSGGCTCTSSASDCPAGSYNCPCLDGGSCLGGLLCGSGGCYHDFKPSDCGVNYLKGPPCSSSDWVLTYITGKISYFTICANLDYCGSAADAIGARCAFGADGTSSGEHGMKCDFGSNVVFPYVAAGCECY